MTRREIFLIVSVACFGIFILTGAFLWRESPGQSQEKELNKQIYARQAEELKKKEAATQSAPAGNPSGKAGKPAQPAPTKAPAPKPPATATPENALDPPPKPAPAAPVNNNLFTQGYKVGDVVKMGNVEMIVTRATSKHKIIEITIEGNTSGQPPRPILLENNRIVFEIPADVNINVDVSEKATIEKAPAPAGIK